MEHNEYINLYLPKNVDDRGRVWVYQAHRELTMQEVAWAEVELKKFVQSWKSHGANVQGYAYAWYNRFLVLIADEANSADVSGCSTDSSVRVVKSIGEALQVDFFNRMNIALWANGSIEAHPMAVLKQKLASKEMSMEHLKFFNNTITSFKDLKTNWLVPIAGSWLASKSVEKIGINI